MAGISAMQSGLAGIHTGMNSLRKDAQVIASQSVAHATNNGGDSKTLTDALVDMKVSERQVEASAKVIETQDEILGTLLDEMA